MTNITNREWIGRNDVGKTITKVLVHSYLNDRKEMITEEILVPLKVVSAIEMAGFEESLFELDNEGNYKLNKKGEPQLKKGFSEISATRLISLTTGLSPQDIDEIRRKKSDEFYKALVALCTDFSGGGKKAEAEKKEEVEEDSSTS